MVHCICDQMGYRLIHYSSQCSQLGSAALRVDLFYLAYRSAGRYPHYHMNLPELTGLIAGIAALITSGGALYAAQRQSASGRQVSWQSLNKALADDRDRLKADLAELDTSYKARIRELDSDYQAQLITARARITQLEKEVEDLYRRLYKVNPP